MKKLFITTTLALTVALSSFTGVFALNQPLEGANNIVISNGEYKFEDFKQELKKGLSTSDLNKAKAQFEKATKLDSKSAKYWNELYAMKIYKEYDSEYKWDKNIALEDIAYDLKDDLSDKDKEKALELYKKALELEMKGDNKDAAEKAWDAYYNSEYIEKHEYNETDNSYMEYSFKDFAEQFKKDISKKDRDKAEQLYKKYVELEKNNKYDEADKIMTSIIELNVFDKDLGNWEEGSTDAIAFDGDDAMEYVPNFKDFSSQFKKGLSKDVTDKAEKLFDEMVKLEKAEQYEKAEKVMADIFKLGVFDKAIEELGSYDDFEEMPEIIDDMKGVDASIHDYTFEDFAKTFKDNISKADKEKAKKLFEQATKAEKDASKAWEELYNMNIFIDHDEYKIDNKK